MRASSSSAALSRSIRSAYLGRSAEAAMAAARSSGVSGVIRDAGGYRRVAATGVGTPRGSSAVTTASPTPSDCSVSARS